MEPGAVRQDRLYIVVRADLPAGSQMAQAIHAAFLFSQEHPDLTGLWHRDSQYLVVLAAPSEQALHDLSFKALHRGIPHSVWSEPDMGNELTALAFAPGNQARRLCANLPLAMREASLV